MTRSRLALSVEVRKGARVAEGQVIARLDPEIADAQVQQAEAAVNAADAQAQMAADVARRNSELSQAGSVSDLQSKSSTSSAAAAAAQLQSAKAQLAQARAARRRHDLRAPFAGVLIPLVLRVSVQEGARASLRPGARVRVEAVSGTAATDDALVKAVIPSADSATRRVPVEITVPNPQGRFTAHTLGRALLSLGAEESALSVPASALASNGGDHVFVLDQRREVRRVPVRVLDRGAKNVVVKADEALSKVVDYPGSDLAEGTRVSAR